MALQMQIYGEKITKMGMAVWDRIIPQILDVIKPVDTL